MVAKLIKQAEEKDSDLASFVRLAVVTGARRGELCALRWTDIDMKTATVRIARSVVGERNDDLAEKSTKTHASRRISLDQATLSSLELQHRPSEERARAVGSELPVRAYVFSDVPDGTIPLAPEPSHPFLHPSLQRGRCLRGKAPRPAPLRRNTPACRRHTRQHSGRSSRPYQRRDHAQRLRALPRMSDASAAQVLASLLDASPRKGPRTQSRKRG